jgi:hypothetical protein
MSEDKLQAARDLIDEKRYDEARALLQTMNHPAADMLLVWLDEEERSMRFTALESDADEPVGAGPEE